jgi:hypothetical protein
MTVDLANILQTILAAGVLGFGGDHFRLRGEVARMRAQFVTWEHMTRFEDKIDRNFEALRDQLAQVAKDLEFLRGRSQGA